MGTPREIAQIAVFHLDGQQTLIEVAPSAYTGRCGEQPELSSAGARRVKGSTTVGTAETMNTVRPYRTTRLLARTGAQTQKAHELRHPPTDSEQATGCGGSRTASSRRRRNYLCRKSWTPCGRYRRRSVRRSDRDPLTPTTSRTWGPLLPRPTRAPDADHPLPQGARAGISMMERYVNVELEAPEAEPPAR